MIANIKWGIFIGGVTVTEFIVGILFSFMEGDSNQVADFRGLYSWEEIL
jgi:hypothetical protein